jgi:hypothetical protein
MRVARSISYGIGIAASAISLTATPVLAQTSWSSGYYVNRDNPLGPKSAGNPNGIWSLNKRDGSVQIRIVAGTTPEGGRGPRIPHILQYNSNSTVSLSGPTPFTSVVAGVGSTTTWQFTWKSAGTQTRDNSGAPVGPWTSVYGPSLFRHFDSGTYSNPGSSLTCGSYAPNLYVDSYGEVHDLRLAVTWLESGSEAGGLSCLSPYNDSVSAETTDGSAIAATISGFEATGGCGSCPGKAGTSPSIFEPDGTVSGEEDTNGNFVKETITGQSGSQLLGYLQDSVGRTIATTPFGLGSTDIGGPGQYTVTTTGPNGEAEPYLVTVAAQSPSWSFSRPHPTTSEVAVLNTPSAGYSIQTNLGAFNV